MTNANTTPDVSHAKTEDLAVLAELGTSRLIALDKIDVHDQVRQELDLDQLAELADSMEEHGLMQDIVLRPNPENPDRFIIIAGERRYRAAQLLGWPAISAKVRLADEEDAARLQLIENIQREELSLADTAAGVARLVDQLGNLKDVAAICGKSVSWVSKHVSAARKLNWRVAKLLEEGRTEDLELLLLLNQLSDLEWFAVDELTRDKMPSRKQVKDAIEKAKADKEADERETARLAEERKAARGQQDLLAKQETPEEKAAREAKEAELAQIKADESLLSGWVGRVSETDHRIAVDQLIASFPQEQLQRIEKMIQADYADAWTAGSKSVTPILMFRAIRQDYALQEQEEDQAAFVLGLTGQDLTLFKWLQAIMEISLPG